MCIRDIYGTNSQEKLHAACSALHFEPVGDDVEWRIVFNVTPVSYTHLLAAVCQADALAATAEIAPVVEEMMKLLPLAFYLLVFEPEAVSYTHLQCQGRPGTRAAVRLLPLGPAESV